MEKQLFDESGLQAVLHRLYALKDEELESEIALIKGDFKKWVENNFSLNEAQAEFIKNLNGKLISFLVSEAGFAMINRLPITLQKSGTAKTSADDADKLFRATSRLQASTDRKGIFKADGSLIIDVIYS